MPKIPAPAKQPGQRRFAMAIERHPSTLYRENYNLLPTTEGPKREQLFMPTPAGVPAKSKTFKPTQSTQHWSGK